MRIGDALLLQQAMDVFGITDGVVAFELLSHRHHGRIGLVPHPTFAQLLAVSSWFVVRRRLLFLEPSGHVRILFTVAAVRNKRCVFLRMEELVHEKVKTEIGREKDGHSGNAREGNPLFQVRSSLHLKMKL